MFASQGLLEHLARGLIGVGAVAVAIAVAPTHPWGILVAVPICLIAWRGCPTCWLVGLLETLAAKGKLGSGERGCVDGRCARRWFD
jgi:hypothetical protein